MGRKMLTFFLNQLCPQNWPMDSRFMVLARLTLGWPCRYGLLSKEMSHKTLHLRRLLLSFLFFYGLEFMLLQCSLNLIAFIVSIETEAPLLFLAMSIYYSIIPTGKDCSQRYGRKTFQLHIVKTERFKNCFVNKLCLNYNLRIWYYLNFNFNKICFFMTFVTFDMYFIDYYHYYCYYHHYYYCYYYYYL